MLPEIEEGRYDIKLRTTEGDSSSVSIRMKKSISISNIYLSLHGGKIRLTGIGLPSYWPHPLFSLNYNWDVIQSTPTYMIIHIPPYYQSRSIVVNLKHIS